MSEDLFVPPFPDPHRKKSNLFSRFYRGWNSWIHVLFDKSYTMMMGEVHTSALSFYITNELSLVDRIMRDSDEFPKHNFLRDVLNPLIGNSIFSANGKAWESQRVMVNPAFSHTALNSVFSMMLSATDELVERIKAMDLSKPIAIDPLMTHVTADIIYRTMFSMTLSVADAKIIYDAFHSYQRYAQSSSMFKLYGLPSFGYRARAERAARRIHEVFEPIVRKRYNAYQAGEGEQKGDILGALLEARHPETGAPFSHHHLMEQVSTIFLAGHETTASAMTWALYLLAECSHVQDRARAEVAVAEKECSFGPASLKVMPVVRNTFREALRLYPPLSFFLREVTKPTQMRDKSLAPGSMLVVSPWLIHRNRTIWTQPHAFDPDRFDRPEEKSACRHAYMPFGKGPRICIGAGFAQQEAMILIARLLSAFDLAPAPGPKPEPVSRLTLRPKNVVRLLLTERRPV